MLEGGGANAKKWAGLRVMSVRGRGSDDNVCTHEAAEEQVAEGAGASVGRREEARGGALLETTGLREEKRRSFHSNCSFHS